MKAPASFLLLAASLAAAPMPQIVHTANKYSLQVDGQPYIVLGAQVSNSSGWPSRFASLLPGAEAMHLNTIEVPVYWEDVEPQEGHLQFDTFDSIIRLARDHHFHLVMLWFGTWKNGAMDYAPAWVKSDTRRFPRMLDSAGNPVRVLTPLSESNLNADRAAFTQLMRHLKEVDGDQHTVIMVQVENETGSLFTDRDHSTEANRQFAGPAPAYANVWLREQKNFMAPGEAYPSGGATLTCSISGKPIRPRSMPSLLTTICSIT